MCSSFQGLSYIANLKYKIITVNKNMYEKHIISCSLIVIDYVIWFVVEGKQLKETSDVIIKWFFSGNLIQLIVNNYSV